MLRTQHLASLENAPLKTILDGGAQLPYRLAKIAPTYKIVSSERGGLKGCRIKPLTPLTPLRIKKLMANSQKHTSILLGADRPAVFGV